MSSRPRRSAAQRATAAITDMADRDNSPGISNHAMSSRSRRTAESGRATTSVSRGSGSAAGQGDQAQRIHLTVKMPGSKLRQTTSSGTYSAAGVGGRTARAGRKNYVVDSESDEEEVEDEEPQDEIEVSTIAAGEDDEDDVEEDEEEEEEEEEEDGDDQEDDEEEEEDEEDEEMELGDEDAEGEEVDEEEDAMDVDAEGEDEELGDEDADGETDMDVVPPPPPPPAIKISKPGRGDKTSSRETKVPLPPALPKRSAATAQRNVVREDDDDEELSELESEPEEELNDASGMELGDDDAEGEDEDLEADAEGEIEGADQDAEGDDDDDDLGSDESGATGSRAETPDLSKMTKRQRARFEEIPQEYMKLSDEVQVKKHFTAEELSMRRAEMARRRRNLSEKRNEEVKMETINKLLKKQAPKTNRRVTLAGDGTPDADFPRANPVFVRWTSTKEGNCVAVPVEILAGPAGTVFGNRAFVGRKIIEEVS